MKHLYEFWNWKRKGKKEKKQDNKQKYYPAMSGPEEDEGTGGYVYTIITKDIEKLSEPISFRTHGKHFLCEDQEELNNIKNKYPIGGYYEGNKIVDNMITRESDGFGTENL